MTIQTLKIAGKSYVVIPEKDFRKLVDRLHQYDAEERQDSAIVRKRLKNTRGLIPLTKITIPLVIKTCPTCGSKRIRRVKRDIKTNRAGQSFVAHGIEIDECPDCGEQLFSFEAGAQIDAQRVRTSKKTRPRKST